MPKPVTPFVGCDSFILDDTGRVLLIRRSDNKLWALPGGCQDLGETPAECAIRETKEETGYDVEIRSLIGVFSSCRYPYIHYPWKDNQFTHILFLASIVGGDSEPSSESIEVRFFSLSELPELSDGHLRRIEAGFASKSDSKFAPIFE